SADQIALAGLTDAGLFAAVWTQQQTDTDGDEVTGAVLRVNRTTTGDGTAETLLGDALTDIILGNGGNDTIRSDTDITNDFYDGGNDFDTIDWSPAFETGANYDLLAGTATDAALNVEQMINFENLIGTSNQDFIFGTNGGNVFDGRAGDDFIDGRGGIDRADYNFSGAPSGYGVVWGGTAANFQFRTVPYGTDTLTNVEVVFLNDTVGASDVVLDSTVITRYFNDDQLGINAYGTSPASGGWANNDLYTRRIGDVNGDGRTDIVAFGSDFTYVSMGQANGSFANPIVGINSFGSGIAGGGWVSDNVYLRKIADVNGDGRGDIVGFGSDYTYVSLGQANGTFGNPFIGINSFGASVPAGGWTNNLLYPREVGDVNGDGRADIVGFGSDHTFVALGQANGTFANPIIGISYFGAAQAGGGWLNQNEYPRMLGDFNGDGRADIIGFRLGADIVSLGQADGTFGGPFNAGSAFSGSNYPANDSTPRMIADLNGDGRDDIIGFTAAGAFGALAQPGGTAFTAPALMTADFGSAAGGGLWQSNAINPRMVGDVDGDNRADIIGFGSTGALVAINSTDFFVI
ncbi:MAG: FG-GAP repeat domain-containing protein, partial [Beijerinckiaceae bacterium]